MYNNLLSSNYIMTALRKGEPRSPVLLGLTLPIPQEQGKARPVLTPESRQMILNSSCTLELLRKAFLKKKKGRGQTHLLGADLNELLPRQSYLHLRQNLCLCVGMWEQGGGEAEPERKQQLEGDSILHLY